MDRGRGFSAIFIYLCKQIEQYCTQDKPWNVLLVVQFYFHFKIIKKVID